MSNFILSDFLPYQLAILSNRISLSFSEYYQKKFGISLTEWRLVAHLSQSEKVSIREIYQKVEMDKSKASRAAARLVDAGYVNKRINAADRRLVELSLTAKGRAMMADIQPMAISFETDVLAQLPEADRKTFLSAVQTLMENST